MEKKKRLPNYLLARELLIEIMHKEKYSVGEALPSVTKLTKRLGLARVSIQQALKILAQEGVLNNVPGSGCYIKNLPVLPPGDSDTVSNSADAMEYSLSGPGGNLCPKKLKIGILPELPEHIVLWEKVFSIYSEKHQDVSLELVKLDFPAFLYNKKALADIDIFQLPAFLLPFFVESGFLFDPVELGGIELPFEFFYDGFIQGASYDGNIYGVPVVIAGICQYYNKKYEPMLKDLFSASGFWDYMERLARVSEEVKTIGFESMIANAESLFALSMLASFDGVPSYDNMKNFESAEFSKFIRRFERYFTDERIFLRGVDFHTADALMQFLEGKTPILMGNASWMAQIVEKSPFEAGIMPQFIEKSGVRQIASNINSISAWTPYPEECFEILKYLSGYEAQKILAENGRPVANLKANKHLKFKRFDDKALEKVMRSWEDGRVLSSGDPGIDEYIKTVINPEISKWQKRELSSYEFVVVLKRKTNFFYRSKSLKSKILTLECEV